MRKYIVHLQRLGSTDIMKVFLPLGYGTLKRLRRVGSGGCDLSLAGLWFRR